MIETPFGNIHGIDDETITMLELRNLFKAIEEGKIKRIVYCVDINPYKQRTFDISKVVYCKNCKKRFSTECKFYMMMCETKDDFFCADGEAKEGEH